MSTSLFEDWNPEPTPKPEARSLFSDWDPTVKTEPVVEPSTDILPAIRRGVKQAVLPHSVEPTDYANSAVSDPLERGAELVSNLVGSLAINTLVSGAGAMAGGVLGAPAGPGGSAVGAVWGSRLASLAYGIYQGVGQEASRSKAQGEEFNAARAAFNSVLETVWLGSAKKVATKVAQVGASAVGEGVKEYSYSKDVDNALLAAGLAGVLGGTIAKVTHGRGKSTLLKDTVHQVYKEPGHNLLARIVRHLERDTEKFHPANPSREFRHWKTEKTGPRSHIEFKEWLRYASPELQLQTWNEFKFHRAAMKASDEAAEKISKELGKNPKDPLGGWRKLISWIHDPHFKWEASDRATGLNIQEDILDASSIALQRLGVVVNAIATAHALPAIKKAKSIGLDLKDVTRLLADLDVSEAAAAKAATAEGKQVLEGFRNAFKAGRDVLIDLGYEVGDIKGYVPVKQMTGTELVLTAERLFKTVFADAKHTKITDISKTDTPEAKALLYLAQRHGIEETKIGPLRDSLLSALKTKSTSVEDLSMPSAVFTRRDLQALPAELREWDAGKLLNRYLFGNLKEGVLGPVYTRIDTAREVLSKIGHTASAKELGRVKEFLKGKREGLGAGLSSLSQSIKLAGAKQGGVFGRSLAAVPDFLAAVNSSIYATTLGLNTKAIIMNASQPLMQVVPELGPKANQWLGAAYGDLAKDRLTKSWKDITTELERHGHLDQVSKTSLLESHGFTGSVLESWRRVNDLVAKAYSTVDVINRYVSMKVGHQWAKAIEAGDPAAIDAFNQLTPGRRVNLTKLSTERRGDALASYLISRTQYRYGPEQQTRLAQYLGPQLNHFTKWPLFKVSEAAEMLAAGQVAKSMRVHFAPALAFLMLFDTAQRERERHPMANYLVGTDWQTFVPGTAALVDPARGPASPVVKGTLALKDWLKNPKDIKGAAARAVLDTIYTVGGPVGAVLGEINKFQRAHNQRAWSKDELESAIKRLLNQVGD